MACQALVHHSMPTIKQLYSFSLICSCSYHLFVAYATVSFCVIVDSWPTLSLNYPAPYRFNWLEFVFCFFQTSFYQFSSIRSIFVALVFITQVVLLCNFGWSLLSFQLYAFRLFRLICSLFLLLHFRIYTGSAVDQRLAPSKLQSMGIALLSFMVIQNQLIVTLFSVQRVCMHAWMVMVVEGDGW